MTSTVQPFRTTRYELASPPTGEHFAFATSSRSADRLFRFVWTLAPGKRAPGVPVPEVETETFEIVSGVLCIWLGDVRHELHAGERLTVPPGTPHRFLNPGKEPAVVNVTLDGPRMEDTFVPCAVANTERPSATHLFRMF